MKLGISVISTCLLIVVPVINLRADPGFLNGGGRVNFVIMSEKSNIFSIFEG